MSTSRILNTAGILFAFFSKGEHNFEEVKEMMRESFFPEMSVNINTATHQQLTTLPNISVDMVKKLEENRPFRSWDEITALPGFSNEITDDLRNGGAVLLP